MYLIKKNSSSFSIYNIFKQFNLVFINNTCGFSSHLRVALITRIYRSICKLGGILLSNIFIVKQIGQKTIAQKPLRSLLTSTLDNVGYHLHN